MKLQSDQTLGQTGLKIPKIIYGTSYLGNLYVELPFEDKLSLMRKWFACTEKPVVIDTAGKYGAGLALEVINRGLSTLGIEPEDVIISNKLGWYRVPLETEEPTFEPGAWANLQHDATQQFGYDEIINCYDQGEQLLGGIYSAQIVSVHDPDEYLASATDEKDRDERRKNVLESYRALFDLKKQGRVKAVGIGSKDWKIINELYADVKFDWVMFANSFTIYSHPKEILDFMDRLHEDGVGIINSALFHGGFLTGSSKFDYVDVDEKSELGVKLYEWRNKFYEICNDFGQVPGEVCIHFGISHPAIASIALNTSKPDKMERNVDIFRKEIPGEFWAELKKERLIDPTYSHL